MKYKIVKNSVRTTPADKRPVALWRRRLVQKLALLMLPLSVIAQDKTPSLNFLEYLGMSAELEEIGVETDKIDTLPEEDEPQPGESDSDSDSSTDNGTSNNKEIGTDTQTVIRTEQVHRFQRIKIERLS